MAASRSALHSTLVASGCIVAGAMKNGLYSVHIRMIDGVKGRDGGVVLRDGALLGG
jgi:hypothetical protein